MRTGTGRLLGAAGAALAFAAVSLGGLSLLPRAPAEAPPDRLRPAPSDTAPDWRRPASASPLLVSAGPSFDCARLSRPVENAVCDAPEVALLDAEMDAAYRAALVSAGPARHAVRRAQRQWLADRDACWLPWEEASDLLCLQDLYRARLAILRAGTAPDPSSTRSTDRPRP